VLDTPDDVRRWWAVTTDADELADPDDWLTGMMRAPVVVVPCSSKAAYLRRYAESDKGWVDRAEGRWPVPFWHMDAAMASLLILQTAVDAGLGACFFGIPVEKGSAVRAAFDLDPDFDPVGVITLGHRTEDTGNAGSPARRRRKPLDDVVHRGRWSGR
jgi:nitroreductase